MKNFYVIATKSVDSEGEYIPSLIPPIISWEELSTDLLNYLRLNMDIKAKNRLIKLDSSYKLAIDLCYQMSINSYSNIYYCVYLITPNFTTQCGPSFRGVLIEET